MPVVLDGTHKNGLTESVPAPLTLTTEGSASLLTMLGNNEEENPEIWRRLPGFYWHAPVLKAKGGAEVLAVHGNRRSTYGPIPLLVTKPAGSGTVLFIGIDSAWRGTYTPINKDARAQVMRDRIEAHQSQVFWEQTPIQEGMFA